MKLLTSAGFLYAAVSANAGNSGAWEDMDYVATLNESSNDIQVLNSALTTSTVYMGLGWDPMVTGLIATFDGGKLIVGYGKTAGAVVKGWMVKMWGASSNSGQVCNAPTASLLGSITGYVSMALKSNADIASTPANCVLSKDAYTQFIWTEQDVAGNAQSIYTKGKTGHSTPAVGTAVTGTAYYINAGNRSSVYLAVTEELDTASNTADEVQMDITTASIADAINYIAVGGVAHGFTFGLGAWYTLVKQVDASGILADYWGQTYELSSPGRHWVAEAAVMRKAGDETGRYASIATGSVQTGLTTAAKGAFGDQQTNSCYTAAGFNTAGSSNNGGAPNSAIEAKYIVGGQTLSGVGCLAIAADGYALSGILVFYKLGNDVSLSQSVSATAGFSSGATVRPYVDRQQFGGVWGEPMKELQTLGGPAITSVENPFASTTGGGVVSVTATAGTIRMPPDVYDSGTAINNLHANFWNMGSVTATAVAQKYGYSWSSTVSKPSDFYLVTASQNYGNSFVIGGMSSFLDYTAAGGFALPFLKETYGEVWSMFVFQKAASTAFSTVTWYWAEVDTFIFCGSRAGKGSCFTWGITASATKAQQPDAVARVQSTTNFLSGGDMTGAVLAINQPAGGSGQFKGLARADKYNEVVCRGVVQHTTTGDFLNMDTIALNGYMLTCYTGIAQCSIDVSTYSVITGFTAASTNHGTTATDCMLDPRYMTWRAMTVKVAMLGNAAAWYRVDSYWDSASSSFASTWGPGLVTSYHLISGQDNYASSTRNSTSVNRTYVFAYADGSGVQVNHVSFGFTVPVANNSSGTTGNALVSAETIFTNAYPSRYNDSLCLSSHLNLTGTTDTSGLSDTITQWSDGYKGKTTIALDYILPGGASGWRGVCIVYYSSQYVMDNTNGAICHLAQVSQTTADGPTDFGASTLQHVMPTDWQPPQRTANVSPSTGVLSGGKYSLTISPSSTTQRIYTSGYYTTAEWYQPKYASSYSGIARYGKDDYVGVFCVQGVSSTSYFQAPATATAKLSSAAAFATGAIALASAAYLAI